MDDLRSWDDSQTISALELELENALEALAELDQRSELPPALRPLLALVPPEGASVHISLRQRASGRQLRRGAPRQEWRPQVCGAWVVYEAPQPGILPRSESSGSPLADFVLALDHAERDPHLSFVSLKWFRDVYLLKRGFAWAEDPDLPRRLVQEATESGVLLTHKVPNPKQPEFPVTSIRLNRQNAEVLRLLENGAHKARETTQ
ncbi:MAG: hypothetical protein IPJ19_16335 [Planctomycetes bacterium]|nr:hypothetical protein [Planctomycetota bacterium]